MINHHPFRFKQFSVDDSRCAMKVGTDAVILGAWTTVCHTGAILDIGTGCGLIALMIAQRSNANITAIDIDESASLQSKENFSASPWHERIDSIYGDVQHFKPDSQYDLIVCNPPYFNNSLKTPDRQRNIARHNDQLSFECLLTNVDRLLKETGTFAFILPKGEALQVIASAPAHQLYLNRCCSVFPRDGKMPNRLMVELIRKETEATHETLIIRGQSNQYTLQYKDLTKDYYLFLNE